MVADKLGGHSLLLVVVGKWGVVTSFQLWLKKLGECLSIKLYLENSFVKELFINEKRVGGFPCWVPR